MTERKLWIGDGGRIAITSTLNGERNARRWGWTPAVAVPSGHLQDVEDILILLNSMNQDGRIEYEDYSQLYDAVRSIGTESRRD